MSMHLGSWLRPPQYILQKSYSRYRIFSPLAYLPFYSLLSNSHMDESSCLGSIFINLPSIWPVVNYFWTYHQQKDVSEVFLHSRYWWALISRKSLITTLKNATAFDNNSVIVIATNSLQVCSYHGWEGLRLCKLFFFSLSRI